MKYALSIFCLVFCVFAYAEEVKVNASNEDLKKMAELEKKRADQAESKAHQAINAAEKKKKKETGDKK